MQTDDNKIIDFHTYKTRNSLPTASNEQLENELKKRDFDKTFPLHVFNKKIHPFLDALHREYDLPRSFIGLSMLSAYSTAIGTAYHVKLNKIGNIYFPVWACLEGMSSSGKSLVMKQVFKPLYSIQEEFEDEWKDQIKGQSDDAISRLPSKQLIYAEAHIPTLIKDVMPHNPKGVLQDADEILAWINGMNQLSKGGKEGTDEQFWLKSWNCSPHRKRLAGNRIFVINKPFLNVFGGAQPSIMWKLFKNDRATTGFIFRILFALPEGKTRIAQPNLLFDMPEEWEAVHTKCINSLFKGLPVFDDDSSRVMEIKPSALKIYNHWFAGKIAEAHATEDDYMREMLAGIVGKMKEYTLRFCGMLHLADKAYDNEKFEYHELITDETMERALEVAKYFYASAKSVCERVNTNIIATAEVLRFAAYIKARYTYQMMGDEEWPGEGTSHSRRMKATRLVKKYIQEYPRVFGAEGK
jgi:hypothetical protein